MSRGVDHLFCDVMAQRIVVGIVDNDAFNGAIQKEPFQYPKLQDDLM